MKHDWSYYNTNSDNRYCKTCGMDQILRDGEWFTVQAPTPSCEVEK